MHTITALQCLSESYAINAHSAHMVVKKFLHFCNKIHPKVTRYFVITEKNGELPLQLCVKKSGQYEGMNVRLVKRQFPIDSKKFVQINFTLAWNATG